MLADSTKSRRDPKQRWTEIPHINQLHPVQTSLVQGARWSHETTCTSKQSSFIDRLRFCWCWSWHTYVGGTTLASALSHTSASMHFNAMFITVLSSFVTLDFNPAAELLIGHKSCRWKFMQLMLSASRLLYLLAGVRRFQKGNAFEHLSAAIFILNAVEMLSDSVWII